MQWRDAKPAATIKAFQMIKDGQTHTYDSFECAIEALAPHCGTRGIRIIGHGLEAGGQFFCCDHCAERMGIASLADRA